MSSSDRALAVLQDPRRTGVDDDQARVRAELAGVAPPVGGGLLVGPLGERVEQLGGVVLVRVVGVLGDPLPDLVLGALGGRHVAEVLVDPVRAEAGDDPVVPPVGGLHLVPPRLRGVPVVADVVVVEDHRAGQRREQPAVGRVGPGELVEVGVLLPVLELGPGRLLDAAAGLDELLHLVGGLVGVHLVAEEQHQVGPADLVVGIGVVVVRAVGDAGHAQGVGAHGVDAVLLVARLVVGDGGAARAEGEPDQLVGLMVAICGSGNLEPASGQTCWPSISTVYAVLDPGSRPSTQTNA